MLSSDFVSNRRSTYRRIRHTPAGHRFRAPVRRWISARKTTTTRRYGSMQARRSLRTHHFIGRVHRTALIKLHTNVYHNKSLERQRLGTKVTCPFYIFFLKSSSLRRFAFNIPVFVRVTNRRSGVLVSIWRTFFLFNRVFLCTACLNGGSNPWL